MIPNNSVRYILSIFRLSIFVAVIVGSAAFFSRNFFNLSALSKAQTETNTQPIEETRYTILGANDVMNEDGNQIDNGSTTAYSWIGTASIAPKSFLGMRFTGGSIPYNAEILTARVELTSSTQQWIGLSTLIFNEESANSESYTRNTRPSVRNRANPSTFSNNELWKNGSQYSINVTNQVQGWAARFNTDSTGSSDRTNLSAIGLIFKGSGSRFGRKYFFNTSGKNSPRLIVSYRRASIARPNTPTQIPPSPSVTKVPPTPSMAPSATGTQPTPTMVMGNTHPGVN